MVGACRDSDLTPGSETEVEILSGFNDNGITTIRFRRPLTPMDTVNDQTHMEDMFIVWAMGGLGSDGIATKHDIRLDSKYSC